MHEEARRQLQGEPHQHAFPQQGCKHCNFNVIEDIGIEERMTGSFFSMRRHWFEMRAPRQEHLS